MSESGGRGSDDSTDLELIARWKAGDERAASELVARHSAALARFAVSSGERNDVDELVQDTFVRAFNSIDGFRGESSFRTWLFTIQRRLLLDRRRAEKRRRDKDEVQDDTASTEYDALDSVVADETRKRLQEPVGRLSRTRRDGFAVLVAGGLS
jgi:RNA polymerase sigma-70 factor (ECF subfamily)